MINVKQLIWDEWNKKHIAEHGITQEEIEEVCRGRLKEERSYRKRLLLIIKTKNGKKLAIVISPENRNGKVYGKGIYYVITAFYKE